MPPSVSPVSPDVGMQLPALQPATRAEANQEAVLENSQASAGKRPQAQQNEARHLQPNGQQVSCPAYGNGHKVLLSFSNGSVLQTPSCTASLTLPQGLYLIKCSVPHKPQGAIPVCAALLLISWS